VSSQNLVNLSERSELRLTYISGIHIPEAIVIKKDSGIWIPGTIRSPKEFKSIKIPRTSIVL
jgi:hypothetical protein